jgi:hypothetical protein
MKKTVLLLALSLSFLACSKSEDTINTNTTLPLTFQNIAGNWNFKSVIRANGTVVPYEELGMCPTEKDYINAFFYGRIDTYNYYRDCVTTFNVGCSQYIYDSNNTILADSFLFGNATITNLTATGFKLVYPEPRPLGFMVDINDAIAIVFERR